jgi:endonuclease/exonuclease/phosphatase family metal-dependent hydrolase
MTAPLPTVRVMTWNIHGTIGRRTPWDIDRTIAFIRRIDPDIVALQEVDSRHPPRDVDPFLALPEALGSHGVGAKSITTQDGEYGQMLISRWPLQATEIHDISYPELEPRRVIKTEIATPHGPLRVLATHLGLALRERQGQAERLLEIAGRTNATTIVMGDFNDWFWPGSIRKKLSWEFPARTRYRTFPSLCPLLRLDRIYCRPARAFVADFVDPLARSISDHLPVIADIQPLEAEVGDMRVSHAAAGV